MSAITKTIERYEAGSIEWDEVLGALEDFTLRKPKHGRSGFDDDGFVWPQDGTVQEVEALNARGSLTNAEAQELTRWLGNDGIGSMDGGEVKRWNLALTAAERSARTKKGWLKRKRAKKGPLDAIPSTPKRPARMEKKRNADFTDEQFRQRKDHWEKVTAEGEWALGGPHDSKVQNTTAKGGYSAKRRALHRKMINSVISDAIARGVPQDRKVLVLGGLGGAGKSSILRKNAEELGIEPDPLGGDRPLSHMVINPDIFKEHLIGGGHVDVPPGFTPLESAHLAHEESSDLADMLIVAANARGLNVIFDMTMGSAPSMKKKMAKLDGYEAQGVFVDVSVEKSLMSADKRYRKGLDLYEQFKGGLGGRPVPTDAIVSRRPKTGTAKYRSSNRENFHSLVDEGLFVRAAVFDNEGDGSTASYPGTRVYTYPP